MCWKPGSPTADGWRWALVACGVTLRILPWAGNPPVWQDEAALALNVVHLGFADYLGPLQHFQAAPPLYLIVERASLCLFDTGEMALRAPAVLAGCASLVLFALLAGRVLEPVPAALAVGLFAVSDRLVWHAAEVKPYAVDAFAAVLVAWGYVRIRDWPLGWQCALWALILPVLLWLSYPACFVASGLILVLLPAAWRAGWGGRLACLGLGLAVAGSFLALTRGPVAAQHNTVLTGFWATELADWSRPAQVPRWVMETGIDVCRYSLIPLGEVLIPVAVAGAVRLARTDRRVLALLLAPVALNLLAALAGRYPFGGGRVNLFLAPAYLLLIGAGAPAVWAWLRSRWRYAPAALVVVLAIPFGQAAYRAVVPWPRPDFRAAVADVRALGRPTDTVAAEHWEVLYYLRGQEDRFCRLADIPARRPDRVWVLTGTRRGAADLVLAQVPGPWERTEMRVYPGAVAVLFVLPAESPAGPADSTSAGGPIP